MNTTAISDLIKLRLRNARNRNPQTDYERGAKDGQINTLRIMANDIASYLPIAEGHQFLKECEL